MATLNLMVSEKQTNSDLQRQSSSLFSLTFADLQRDPTKNFGSMSMEDLFKNIYSDSLSPEPFSSPASSVNVVNGGVTAVGRQGSFSLPKNMVNKTVDEVWKYIVSGESERMPEGVQGNGIMEGMTLEAFLTKAGAVREDEVRDQSMSGLEVYDDDGGTQFQQQMQNQRFDDSILGFGNGIDERGSGSRGKKRMIEEHVDKATQQKQKRMIKNRESAARSRERKQAYTDELEMMVTQLKEENEMLRKKQAEEFKERLKQLMEGLIPVTEAPKPPRVLRRVTSMEW